MCVAYFGIGKVEVKTVERLSNTMVVRVWLGKMPAIAVWYSLSFLPNCSIIARGLVNNLFLISVRYANLDSFRLAENKLLV
jgi:hypothetical protein